MRVSGLLADVRRRQRARAHVHPGDRYRGQPRRFPVQTITPDGQIATIAATCWYWPPAAPTGRDDSASPARTSRVHTDLGDPHRFFGRTVLVVGGRNSAAESALRLYRVGARVHLAHREPELHPRVKHWIRRRCSRCWSRGRLSAICLDDWCGSIPAG